MGIKQAALGLALILCGSYLAQARQFQVTYAKDGPGSCPCSGVSCGGPKCNLRAAWMAGTGGDFINLPNITQLDSPLDMGSTPNFTLSGTLTIRGTALTKSVVGPSPNAKTSFIQFGFLDSPTRAWPWPTAEGVFMGLALENLLMTDFVREVTEGLGRGQAYYVGGAIQLGGSALKNLTSSSNMISLKDCIITNSTARAPSSPPPGKPTLALGGGIELAIQGNQVVQASFADTHIFGNTAASDFAYGGGVYAYNRVQIVFKTAAINTNTLVGSIVSAGSAFCNPILTPGPGPSLVDLTIDDTTFILNKGGRGFAAHGLTELGEVINCPYCKITMNNSAVYSNDEGGSRQDSTISNSSTIFANHFVGRNTLLQSDNVVVRTPNDQYYSDCSFLGDVLANNRTTVVGYQIFDRNRTSTKGPLFRAGSMGGIGFANCRQAASWWPCPSGTKCIDQVAGYKCKMA